MEPGCPTGSGTIEVLDSTTEEPIGSIPEGTAEDVDKAVNAAGRLHLVSVSHEERSKLLARAAERLSARTDELAETISKEVGMPIGLSKIIQVGLPAGVFADMAKEVTEFTWEREVGSSLVVREPVGVVGGTSLGIIRSTRSR